MYGGSSENTLIFGNSKMTNALVTNLTMISTSIINGISTLDYLKNSSSKSKNKGNM